MDEQFKLFMEQIKTQTDEQTKVLLSSIDEKLEPLISETKKLKIENEQLKERVHKLEFLNRKNNIIVFGFEETEKNNMELLNNVTKTFQQNSEELSVYKSDINAAYRVGKKVDNSKKPRPVKISFLNYWKKEQIMNNKKQYAKIYITEDYPKEVVDKRKSLQEQMQEERKKGNFAIIKYDQLIIKTGGKSEKRKRDLPTTPEENAQTRKQYVPNPAKVGRMNAFDLMRTRSNSVNNIPTASETQ